jgi:hypothetical protein
LTDRRCLRCDVRDTVMQHVQRMYSNEYVLTVTDANT